MKTIIFTILFIFSIGIYAQDSSAVAGLKFWDKNHNGMPDAGEPLLKGWVIYADLNHNGKLDPGEPSSTTDNFGQFTLIVPKGKYIIREQIKNGWFQTKPGKPNFYYLVDTNNQPDNLFFGNDSAIYDFGDLPFDGINLWFNTKLPFGPRHMALGPMLGNKRDVEFDGQPDGTATGDDQDGNDDEDGVKFTAFHPGGNGTALVTVNGIPPGVTAYLNAWIDFNGNGSFGVGEDIIVPRPMPIVVNGQFTLNFIVPAVFNSKGGYARFRLSTDENSVLNPDGEAPDGEVEDYFALGLDFGDSHNLFEPALPNFPGGYPTSLSDNGARHIKISNIRLGDAIDSDNPAHPSLWANGDNNFNLNDEDGIYFLNGAVPLYIGTDPDNTSNILTLYGFYRGSTVRFKPLASVSGYLNLWLDWDGNSNWTDSTFHIDHTIIDKPIDSGPNYTIVSFTVPSDASFGWTYARYRFCTKSGVDYNGPAVNGEVEDYIYKILPQLDFGDAPDSYNTLAVDDGPKDIVGNTYLGNSVDADNDGQPDSLALGDDNDGNNDDDGVVFLDSLITKNIVRVRVTASAPSGSAGILNAWIDFNRNGQWENSEHIFQDISLFSGIDTLSFNVPDSSVNGLTYARFRYSSTYGEGYKDSSMILNPIILTGEIEDYSVNISGGITDISINQNTIPQKYEISQNYPNPFNPTTTISYQLPKASRVSLVIFDVLGRKVKTLVNKEQPAGYYNIQFDASSLSSGIYFYRIYAENKGNDFVQVKKMVLLK